MQIDATAALWFVPFVLPLCFYVAYTDMREMRITNQAVIALVIIYVLVGPFVFPLATYAWGFVHLIVVLVIGIALNAAGAMGAGDAKFAAAAAPLIHLGDLRMLMALMAATLLAAVVTHRIAKLTPLRGATDHWESWTRKGDFPMGLALGGTLGIYLILGSYFGV